MGSSAYIASPGWRALLPILRISVTAVAGAMGDMGDEMTDGRVLRDQNDRDGLLALDHYGWLRPQELGTFLWCHATHRTKYAERLTRRWMQAGYVLPRRLPDHQGTAFVLAARGVRHLESCGYSAQSGTDWGCTQKGVWQPPLSWRHDLIAHGILLHLFQSASLSGIRDISLVPENQIRRHAPLRSKIPDGLAVLKSESGQVRTIWLEVECARKSGHSMQGLAQGILDVSAGRASPVFGFQPTEVWVAYVRDSLDERRMQLNHRERVSAALQRLGKARCSLSFCEVVLKGAGVDHFTLCPCTIEGDEVAAKRARLDQIGWVPDPETGGRVCVYAQARCQYWQAGGVLAYRLLRCSDEGIEVVLSGTADSVRACKQLLAEGLWFR